MSVYVPETVAPVERVLMDSAREKEAKIRKNNAVKTHTPLHKKKRLHGCSERNLNMGVSTSHGTTMVSFACNKIFC